MAVSEGLLVSLAVNRSYTARPASTSKVFGPETMDYYLIKDVVPFLLGGDFHEARQALG